MTTIALENLSSSSLVNLELNFRFSFPTTREQTTELLSEVGLSIPKHWRSFVDKLRKAVDCELAKRDDLDDEEIVLSVQGVDVSMSLRQNYRINEIRTALQNHHCWNREQTNRKIMENLKTFWCGEVNDPIGWLFSARKLLEKAKIKDPTLRSVRLNCLNRDTSEERWRERI